MDLFLDTTVQLFVGIIDENNNWVDKVSEENKKISQNIHKVIYKLLDKNNLNFSDVSRVVYCAGPGSYTGMRVSAGLADILEWNGVEVVSFYHFEIPKFAGYKNGKWIADAFKKELFVYSWDENNEGYELIPKEKFSIGEEKLFSQSNIMDFTSANTIKILEDKIKEIMSNIKFENKKLFYYRKLEDEFSKC